MKLNAANAAAAAQKASDWGTNLVLDPGVYICQLVEVVVKDGREAPYWRWEFDVTDPDAPKGKKIWENTSLAEKAIGRLGKMFESFGVSPDTDTDELIGLEVWCQIGVRTIDSGPREGEQANEIIEVIKLVEYDEDGAASDGESDADDDESMTDDGDS